MIASCRTTAARTSFHCCRGGSRWGGRRSDKVGGGGGDGIVGAAALALLTADGTAHKLLGLYRGVVKLL
jgi:hypothetical protein